MTNKEKGEIRRLEKEQNIDWRSYQMGYNEAMSEVEDTIKYMEGKQIFTGANYNQGYNEALFVLLSWVKEQIKKRKSTP